MYDISVVNKEFGVTALAMEVIPRIPGNSPGGCVQLGEGGGEETAGCSRDQASCSIYLWTCGCMTRLDTVNELTI